MTKDEYHASEFLQALKRIWTEDIVEFKGEYYNIPVSKIGPKPIHKPHPPIYIGGLSPNTYSRVINYETNGWLGVIAGPLEYLDNTMKTIKDLANRANKNPNNFKVILLTYPKIVFDSKGSQSAATIDESQRFPLIGTVDQVGNDIQRIKQMDVDHIILAYNFIPIGRDIDKMIDITKQLSRYAR